MIRRVCDADRPELELCLDEFAPYVAIDQEEYSTFLTLAG